ncbi:MAG: RsmE family RNA methyltransferase [Spirochaetales bacterium]|nr:RsmE family RNA methyltransferase [Spirochaetales bacterium]
MNICLFTSEEIKNPLSTADERGQHLIKVLHKKEGESFSAGVIGGKAGKATIEKIEDGKIFFSFVEETDGKNLFPLKMIIGFPRPIQLKRLLRDMAALGVCEVHLTKTELTEKSYLSSDLATTDAGTKMLLDGTVQAASTHVPELFIHKSLRECLDYIKENSGAGIKLCALDNIEPTATLGSLEFNSEEGACAAIGSERGWTAKERQLMKENGFTLLGMGSRVMRTETAATVAASIILNSMGCLA